MSEEHDRQFIKHFSVALVALIAFTAIVGVVAYYIHVNYLNIEPSTARESAKEERLRPVAGVHAGEAGRAAAEAEAAVENEPELAFDGSTDGEMIYNQVCAACHSSGVAGAPTLAPAGWSERLDKGRDELLASAINGLGAMPPRGGRSDLSDEQVAASVDYMLDQVE